MTARVGIARPRPWLRRAAVLAVGLCLLLLGAALWVGWLDRDDDGPRAAARPMTPADADAPTLARGAYLARVGNCAGCHTARGGAPYAGGRGLPTPFGTVYAGNLTPDARTGLGAWSADDFWRALHHGRSRDGRRLTPAFPYTEFTRITRADSDALFAHLRRVPAVVQANRAHALRFPFGTQAALAVWRALFFRPAVFTPEASRPAEWNRGAYLVQGPGHCAACHAPRNALGATQDAQALAGGDLPMQPWFAPALGLAGSGEAELRDLMALLKTGISARGTASGPMAEVVFRSTQHWTDEDLRAVALYLQSLPPVRPAAGAGRVPVTTAAAEQRALGAQIYRDHCAACHGAEGEGAPGAYPPLAGNPTVRQPSPSNLIQVVRHGGFAPATAGNPRPYGMPPLPLSDAEIAAVLSFVRQSWGLAMAPVTERDVTRSR